MDLLPHERQVAARVEELRAGGIWQGANNLLLREAVTKVTNVLRSASRAAADWERRGWPSGVRLQIAKAVEDAMAEFQAFAQSVLALPPHERAMFGAPPRGPSTHPGTAEAMTRERLRHEANQTAAVAAVDAVEAAGGYCVIVAPTQGFGNEAVQVVGIRWNALSEETRAVLRTFGHLVAGEIRRRQGIVN